MKTKIAMVCLLVFATACSSKQTQTPAHTLNKKATGTFYTCTMHPNILSSKPGTCPKCGMELVEKDNSK